MTWLYWFSGLSLALAWLVSVFQAAIHTSELVDVTRPEWKAERDLALPSVTIVVPARNEEVGIEPALQSLMRLNYPSYEVIAVDDRSTDRTGEIMQRIAREQGVDRQITHSPCRRTARRVAGQDPCHVARLAAG
jgi:cellulose synthase/poly-beta-1,6-N-acetylglucosamine synthase-like glycosyltransferase